MQVVLFLTDLYPKFISLCMTANKLIVKFVRYEFHKFVPSSGCSLGPQANTFCILCVGYSFINPLLHIFCPQPHKKKTFPGKGFMSHCNLLQVALYSLYLSGSSASEMDVSRKYLWVCLHIREWRVVIWHLALGNLLTGYVSPSTLCVFVWLSVCFHKCVM